MSIGVFQRDLEGIPDFEVVFAGKGGFGFEGKDRFAVLIKYDEDTIAFGVYVLVRSGVFHDRNIISYNEAKNQVDL